jgi:hypothetical protein
MEHLLNIFILLGLLLGFYSIGYVLNHFTKIAQEEDKPYSVIFSHLLSGLVFSISITACIFTSFVTTSILFLVLFGYIGFVNKDKIAATSFYLPKLSVLPFFVLVGYLLSVFKGYDSEGNYTHHIFLDYIYFKQVIANLINGQENASEWANILDKEYNGIAPYHYFEFWLTILVGKINALPSILNFMVYVPTIFTSVILFGITSILESNRKISLKHLFIVIAFLFVGQVYLPFYEYFFWSGYQHVFTSVGYLPIGVRSFPFILFSVAGFSAFSQKKYDIFLCYLLFLSIASFAATPSVFGAFYLLLLSNVYFRFIEDKRIYFLAIFPILYAIFLFVFKQSIDGYVESSSQIGFTTAFQRFTVKNVIIFFILRPGYFLFPALLLSILLLIRKKIVLDKLIIFALIFFIGLIGASSLVAVFYSFDANSIQLIVLPLHGFSFALLIWLINRVDRKMYISILLVSSMIIINFYYNYSFFHKELNYNKSYSEEYITTITKKLDTKTLIPVAAFYSFDIPFNFVMFDGLGKEVIYLDNVGLIRMTNATLEERENIKNSSVNIFYKFIKENDYPLENDMSDAQITFFKKNNIHHLLIQKGQKISPNLERLVIESYTDSISGNRFCIINLNAK